MKKILITGGAGFIGSHVVRRFVNQYPNYDIYNLPHDNTLEAAKEYCINNCCSGITLENNIYQVRRGRYLYNNNDNNIYTWIHL
jgi:nucleoside-diphosphate-sugar epimerase